MAVSGRKMRIIKGSTSVAGARTDNLTISNEPVDITDKDDGGWRTLHTEAGAITLSADVEGVLKDAALIQVVTDGTALLTAYTIDLEGIGRFNGNWFLSGYSVGAAQADAITFTCNIENSGAIAVLAPSVLPAVTGTAQVGQTLTTTNGTWLGSPTFARQWQDSADGVTWANITSATGLTYILAIGQLGDLVRCKVTATAAYGNVVVYSNSVGPVIAA